MGARTREFELDLRGMLLQVGLESVEVLLEPRDISLEHRVVLSRLLRRLATCTVLTASILEARIYAWLFLIVLLGLVAALDLLQVAHAMAREHWVLELHRAVSAAERRMA